MMSSHSNLASDAYFDRAELLAGNGRYLEQFCLQRGIDLKPILQNIGMELDALSHFGNRICLDKFCRLLEALAILTDEDTFGLKYGLFFKLGGTGPVGYGLANAPTPLDALKFFARYVYVLGDVQDFELDVNKNSVTVSWTLTPAILRRDQFCDYTTVGILRHLRECAGKFFELKRARFERQPPQDKSLHRRTFSRVVEFGAATHMLELPIEFMTVRNNNADQVLFEYMDSICSDLLIQQHQRKDTIQALRADFLKHIEQDDCALKDVAHRLRLSERSLQRRLTQHGTTFWDQLELTRAEFSGRLLGETTLPFSEISRRLGYSSQSAYTRAVARWYGKPPGAVRRDLIAGAKTDQLLSPPSNAAS